MEQKKVEFEQTDLIFHSRDFRPTQKFERAREKARTKGSDTVRVYGTPCLVIDPTTMLVYFELRFSDEIAKKIKNGELIMRPNAPHAIDKETQKKMKDKEKRKLKNSTKVWRKNN